MQGMTTEHRTVQLLHAWVERFNQDDRAGFAALLAPEIEFQQVSTGDVDRTVEGVVRSMWSWRALFTAIHGEVLTAFASGSGDQGFMAVIWSGTARGGPAGETSRTIRFVAWFTMTVHNQLIVAAQDFYDRLTYQQQIGSGGAL
jgi:hypothetical protein